MRRCIRARGRTSEARREDDVVVVLRGLRRVTPYANEVTVVPVGYFAPGVGGAG